MLVSSPGSHPQIPEADLCVAAVHIVNQTLHRQPSIRAADYRLLAKKLSNRLTRGIN